MALMMAQAVPQKAGPSASSMAVPHGPAGVGAARLRLRNDLGDRDMADSVIDDAVLVLSELLSNSCRYARPLARLSEPNSPAWGDSRTGDRPGGVLVSWQTFGDGTLILEVTDGGAPTRPLPASPSLTAHGGRGLSIVSKLANAWGVRDAPGEVTVWVAIPHPGEPGSGGGPKAAR